MCKNGYYDKNISIRPNKQIYLIFLIQLNTGLRIGDVLGLKKKNFNNNFIYLKEQKTGKTQHRKINGEIIEKIDEYCLRQELEYNDRLFSIKVRWVQRYLQKISKILDMYEISTHSFRKTYAHLQYIENKCNIELVRKLLNHSSIAVTQRYLGITDEEVNKASENFKIIF